MKKSLKNRIREEMYEWNIEIAHGKYLVQYF